jgi:hypothetical protein
MSSIVKFENIKGRHERSRDNFDLVKSQTVEMRQKKLNKNSPCTKSYSRRVSCEANQIKTIFLGANVASPYVGSTIQCNNSRPVSRGKMRSPMGLKNKKNNRYTQLNSSKNSTMSKQSIANRTTTNLSSIKQKLTKMQNSTKSTIIRGRDISKSSSKAQAQAMLQFRRSPNAKNHTMKAERESNIIGEDLVSLKSSININSQMKSSKDW